MSAPIPIAGAWVVQSVSVAPSSQGWLRWTVDCRRDTEPLVTVAFWTTTAGHIEGFDRHLGGECDDGWTGSTGDCRLDLALGDLVYQDYRLGEFPVNASERAALRWVQQVARMSLDVCGGWTWGEWNRRLEPMVPDPFRRLRVFCLLPTSMGEAASSASVVAADSERAS